MSWANYNKQDNKWNINNIQFYVSDVKLQEDDPK